MSVWRKMAPHGAMVIAHMYYVFYGIDRVNKPMNFIDNGLTKTLLLVLCILDATVLAELARWLTPRRRRREAPMARWMRFGALAVNALLAVVYWVLWLVDLCAPHKMLMLNEFVKAWMLALCIVTEINAIRLTARQRRVIRAEQRNRRQRRPARPAYTYNR